MLVVSELSKKLEKNGYLLKINKVNNYEVLNIYKNVGLIKWVPTVFRTRVAYAIKHENTDIRHLNFHTNDTKLTKLLEEIIGWPSITFTAGCGRDADWYDEQPRTHRSSYWEEEYGRLVMLLNEVKTGKPPVSHDYKRAVFIGKNKNDVDKLTEELCTVCQNLNVQSYSLELQLWWRDHQARIKREEEEKKKVLNNIRMNALKKLSYEEIKALGINVILN